MRRLMIFISILVSIVSLEIVSADTLNLYQKPNATSKVLASVKPGEALIPIYYPKEGSWIKVADPSNGHVGWVKLSKFNGQTKLPGIDGFTFQQRVVTRSDGTHQKPEVYRVIQYAGSKKLNKKQLELYVKKLQQQERQFENEIQQVLAKMEENFSNFELFNPLNMEQRFFDFPMIQPVIIVPEKTSSTKETAHTKKQVTSNKNLWEKFKAKLSNREKQALS